MHESEALYVTLRRLVVEDPREAKLMFLQKFEANSTDILGLFTLIGRPNEGRLRQMVANALRVHPEKHRVVEYLRRWQEVETDEFTRRAIEGALVDVSPSEFVIARSRQIAPTPQLTATYRYVADRLRHRLRNAMLPAQAHTSRLKALSAAGSAEVQTTVAKLNDSMLAVARILEIIDVDASFFEERTICLPEWIQQMNGRRAAQYESVALFFRDGGGEHRIIASEYLLDIIFSNIWLNAQQVAGPNCAITIEIRDLSRDVELVILDNAEGFPADLEDILFQQVYSTTRRASRGRGLLEIQDAVERLGGNIQLVDVGSGEYRLRIRLPLEQQ